MMETCRWCNTAPNGDDKSCTEYTQAVKCSWLPSADRKALARREQERKDDLVRRAAPNMLAALRAVMSEWREGYGLRCEQQVRAAIAEALGGNSDDRVQAGDSGGVA